MTPDPVRAKIRTEGIVFCPNRDCRVAVYLDRLDGDKRCPCCDCYGIPASVTIGLVERRPIETEPTRYREDGDPTT